MAKSIRREIKQGMLGDHRRWDILEQFSDKPDSSLVYEQFGTRIKLAGLRVSKPASSVVKVPLYKISGLL